MQKQKMTYAHPQGLLNAASHIVSIMKNVRGDLNVLSSGDGSVQFSRYFLQ